MEEFQYEALTSLVQAASELLHHLLTSHGSAIQERSLVLSDIFHLLGKSITFAKRHSSLGHSDSKASKETQSEVEKCQEIFLRAFRSLRGFLEHQLSGNLLYGSENGPHEELQVHILNCSSRRNGVLCS